jgi:hypothetical protein
MILTEALCIGFLGADNIARGQTYLVQEAAVGECRRENTNPRGQSARFIEAET